MSSNDVPKSSPNDKTGDENPSSSSSSSSSLSTPGITVSEIILNPKVSSSSSNYRSKESSTRTKDSVHPKSSSHSSKHASSSSSATNVDNTTDTTNTKSASAKTVSTTKETTKEGATTTATKDSYGTGTSTKKSSHHHSSSSGAVGSSSSSSHNHHHHSHLHSSSSSSSSSYPVYRNRDIIITVDVTLTLFIPVDDIPIARQKEKEWQRYIRVTMDIPPHGNSEWAPIELSGEGRQVLDAANRIANAVEEIDDCVMYIRLPEERIRELAKDEGTYSSAVKSIGARCGARIFVPKPTEEHLIVTLEGTLHQVKNGLGLIVGSLLRAATYYKSEIFTIPGHAIGPVLGQSGKTLNDMINVTCVSIEVLTNIGEDDVTTKDDDSSKKKDTTTTETTDNGNNDNEETTTDKGTKGTNKATKAKVIIKGPMDGVILAKALVNRIVAGERFSTACNTVIPHHKSLGWFTLAPRKDGETSMNPYPVDVPRLPDPNATVGTLTVTIGEITPNIPSNNDHKHNKQPDHSHTQAYPSSSSATIHSNHHDSAIVSIQPIVKHEPEKPVVPVKAWDRNDKKTVEEIIKVAAPIKPNTVKVSPTSSNGIVMMPTSTPGVTISAITVNTAVMSNRSTKTTGVTSSSSSSHTAQVGSTVTGTAPVAPSSPSRDGRVRSSTGTTGTRNTSTRTTTKGTPERSHTTGGKLPAVSPITFPNSSKGGDQNETEEEGGETNTTYNIKRNPRSSAGGNNSSAIRSTNNNRNSVNSGSGTTGTKTTTTSMTTDAIGTTSTTITTDIGTITTITPITDGTVTITRNTASSSSHNRSGTGRTTNRPTNRKPAPSTTTDGGNSKVTNNTTTEDDTATH